MCLQYMYTGLMQYAKLHSENICTLFHTPELPVIACTVFVESLSE